jgi:hypothetical protein
MSATNHVHNFAEYEEGTTPLYIEDFDGIEDDDVVDDITEIFGRFQKTPRSPIVSAKLIDDFHWESCSKENTITPNKLNQRGLECEIEHKNTLIKQLSQTVQSSVSLIQDLNEKNLSCEYLQREIDSLQNTLRQRDLIIEVLSAQLLEAKEIIALHDKQAELINTAHDKQSAKQVLCQTIFPATLSHLESELDGRVLTEINLVNCVNAQVIVQGKPFDAPSRNSQAAIDISEIKWGRSSPEFIVHNTERRRYDAVNDSNLSLDRPAVKPAVPSIFRPLDGTVSTLHKCGSKGDYSPSDRRHQGLRGNNIVVIQQRHGSGIKSPKTPSSLAPKEEAEPGASVCLSQPSSRNVLVHCCARKNLRYYCAVLALLASIILTVVQPMTFRTGLRLL